MAKTHEEEKPQRTLTPDEAARRKAALEGGDPAKVKTAQVQTSDQGGPVEGYLSRLERAAQVPSPMAIDYDRDGYPDALVGRSGRNLDQRIKQVDAEGKAARTAQYADQVGRGTVYTVGTDGYRQDQVGYRARLRARVDAMAQVVEAEGEPVDPEVQALADMGVESHGGTGVPGGMPAGATVPPDVPETMAFAKRTYTPLEQAMMAPQTPTTGFVNKGAAIAIPGGGLVPRKPKPPGGGGEEGGEGGEGGEGEAPPVPGPEGPFPTSHRGSFGTVPIQGTHQPDGSFTVGGVTATPPEEGKGKAKDHGKPHEPPKHEPPKHEPAKAHEHGKQPEHHGKK